MQDNASIIDVNEQNIQQVLEASRQTPVLVDFWAPWCQPCLQMAPTLEKLAGEYQGKLILAKVNADEQQNIAAQFGVRSLPSLKLVYQGQLVAELEGAQSEGALRQWLAPVLDPEAAEKEQEEGFLEQVRMAIDAGHGDQAEQALRQTLQQQPDKHAFRALLVEFLLGEGRQDEAQSVLAEIAEDVEELRPFRARFALLDKLPAGNESLKTLAERINASGKPEDLHAYGLRAAAAGQFREGLEALLTLLRDHRDYEDGVARAALLQVFDCLPKGDPLASEYRRKMFTYLY
ncbi:Thioredoxin domain protein [Alloalcanivorax dieselolei B5]|uniref:Thioredoxin domain protein n=1 Tax=Alcanivorax dieselolei (strain DSM 16502 / CGMCC 1.3690 / MCCC 1A00001 / B-5) TaxID=930169 RepID=K0CF07_ALCDB|nr:tetratricopeptide repeat protein [Alloalcanivorax dieselolei]AFT70176.1 Thioredoxin domain protein [Alloalcanivorax dieselolei B5]GGJ95849.1 co-chaperone YbbN [Alloalcanivorax dieselolei]